MEINFKNKTTSKKHTSLDLVSFHVSFKYVEKYSKYIE